MCGSGLGPPPPDSPGRRVEVARFLLAEAVARERPGRGAPAHVRLRSHLMHLLTGFPGASSARQRVLRCQTSRELDEVLVRIGQR